MRYSLELFVFVGAPTSWCGLSFLDETKRAIPKAARLSHPSVHAISACTCI